MKINEIHITVTDENFQKEILESPEAVLVDFWADWCGPCHMMAPVIEELAGEYEGRVKVGKLDVDKNPHTASRYGIRSIPSSLFFKNGQEVDRVIGAVAKKELVDKLDALL